MKKTVIFIRHAKSSWKEKALRDIERPLNPRGLRDVPIMASKLKEKVEDVDFILSSAAVRTRMTASYFMEAYGLEDNQVKYTERLYLPDVDDVISELALLSDDVDRVLVFGHNPCWTMLINMYAEDFISNVPTCGIGIVDFEMKEWSDIYKTEGKMTDYLYPKMYL